MKYLKLFENTFEFDKIISEIKDISYIMEDENCQVKIGYNSSPTTTPKHPKKTNGSVVSINIYELPHFPASPTHFASKKAMEGDCRNKISTSEEYIEFKERIKGIAKKYNCKFYENVSRYK